MDIPTALVLILALAGLVLWMVHPSTGQALDAFGSGFIGYREAGWPIGVQEEEPVHFSFPEPPEPTAEAWALGTDPEPELIELDDAPDGEIPLERVV